MTAEEKLKELYRYHEGYDSREVKQGLTVGKKSMLLLPEHIDLIANLVVERLRIYLDPIEIEEVNDG